MNVLERRGNYPFGFEKVNDSDVEHARYVATTYSAS